MLTNKTPVGTYRGPGRFETDFFRERLLDMVAQDLGIDRVEFRRRNLVAHARDALPLATITPFESKDEFDSGDYQATLDRCLAEFGWAEKAKLQGKLIDGRYHGLAVGCFIEGGAAGPKESARIVLEPDGALLASMSARPRIGQGLETVVRADRRRRARSADGAHPRRLARLDVVCDRRLRRLSLALDGDGRLGHARRGRQAARGDPRARRRAARLRARRDRDRRRQRRGRPRRQIGRRCRSCSSDGLAAEGAFLNKKHTYTYGAHAAHVAVDPKLGHVELIDYVIVEDCGRAINPLTLHGQAIGSVVQGLGGAFMEHLVYDEQGQLLTGSLADYLMPTASDFPHHPRRGAGGPSLADQSARRQGRRRGRHHRRRRRHGQCGRQRAVGVRRQPRELPLTPARVWELAQAAAHTRAR